MKGGPKISITMDSPVELEPGDRIAVGEKNYVVERVVDRTFVTLRRTFWQWIKDTWARFIAWCRS